MIGPQDSGLDNEAFFGGTPDDDDGRQPVPPWAAERLEQIEMALADLFDWAEEANAQLLYNYPKPGEFMFGGNPHTNPLFKRVRDVLGIKVEVVKKGGAT